MRFISLLAILAVSGSSASPLFEWRFEDPVGTPLSQAANSGIAEENWEADFLDTLTDGQGNLLVRRTPDGPANSFVGLRSLLPPVVWVVAEIEGWHFAGSSATETLRLGLAHHPHESHPSVLAQLRLERVAADAVVIAAEGFGDGATATLDFPIFSSIQTEPVTFVLEVNQPQLTFKLHYRVSNGPFLFLGEGSISPDREARFLRFGLTGHFGASGESLSISRIAYLAENPLADP